MVVQVPTQNDHLLAGILGGTVSTVLLFPLDLVKVRLQVNEHNGKSSIMANSFLRTFRQVIRHEGLLGLYQGMSPAIIGSSASWGGYFFLYEGMKQKYRSYKRQNRNDHLVDDDNIRLSAMDNFITACGAGAIMVLFTNPIWLVKTRMQLQMRGLSMPIESNVEIKKPYTSMRDAFQTIAREEGLFALYKGAVPALMLVSHGGVQFVVYEFLKNRFGHYKKAQRGERNQSITDKLHDSTGYLIMGAIAKIVASTTTYPLQVIKSRLQQRSQAVEISEVGEIQVSKREYNGVIDCIRRIWINEGVGGFFKGCLPNAVRVAPSAAITFVTYETTLDALCQNKPR